MEDNKKKKKNKRKKGKQNKTSDVAVSSGRETTSVGKNRVIAALEQNHESGTSDTETVGVLEYDTSVDERQSNDMEGAILDEAEKQIWLEREKYLEEELRQVQRSWIWKEASLDGQIQQLLREKDCYIQTEASLEKKIIQLQRQKDTWLEKEVGMEEKIKELMNERAFWIQKGASLEDKIKHLESDKESWALKEKSTEEEITRLNEDNIWLQIQVKELEESKNSLFQENQQFRETISHLQSQVQHLEKENILSAFLTAETEKVQQVSKDEDSNAQIGATCTLVDEPMRENAELDKKSVTPGHPSMDAFNPAEAASETVTVADFMPEFREKMVESGERINPPVSVQSKDERTDADNEDNESITVTGIHIEEPSESYETGEIEEIVQIPLDDNEIRETESQVAEIDGNVSVPLSEAPLIGAPFRLISFVAKYVSGADLVSKKTSTSGR